jgi:hypothetical protein
MGGICSQGIGQCFSWTANVGMIKLRFTRPSAGPNCVLDINQFENDDVMSVYPNPSDGQLNIRIKFYWKSKYSGN